MQNRMPRVQGPHILQEKEHERMPLLESVGGRKQASAMLHQSAIDSSPCRRRLRRSLLMTLPLLAAIIGACMLISTHIVGHFRPELRKDSICVTPGCVLASADLLRSRSPNYAAIEPCDDFRAYMCEGFDAAHDFRPDQTDIGSFSILYDVGQTILRHILEAPMPEMTTFAERSSTDEENFEKLHDAYAACQNESEIAKKGLKPLLELVRHVTETFNSPNNEGAAVSETCSLLFELGATPLVELGIITDDKDPDVNVLAISPPARIGLPAKQYYEDRELLQKYTEMIAQVHQGFFKEMGSGFLAAKDFSAKELVDFEIKLAAASPTQDDREDVTKYYNPRTLQNVSAIVPQLDIPTLIKKSNPSFQPDKVIVWSPTYLVEVSGLLDETDKEIVQSYFIWKTVQRFASAVEADAVVPLKRFNNLLHGKDPDAKPERWRTCLQHVDDGLGWILSRFFVEKAFSEAAKAYGDQIILDIKAEFVRKLDTSKWMSKEVRKVAIDKVHNIIQKIGYPTASPDIRNSTELASYYERVKVSSHDYFNNVLSMARDDVKSNWDKATKPVDRNEWDMTASTVNAYYNPPGNEIVFPAGIMQPTNFYPPEIPNYLSYGAFGSVAGHELSHAFDSTGRHYDQNGNYTDWWDESTVANFQHKADCFVQEYGNYTIIGPDGKPHHVNGRLTLGENIADAGGLSSAFQAWKAREAEKPAQLLPGLQEYSKDQVFFMSYGHVWCGKTRPAAQLNRLYTDPHSPTAARIQLTLANSEEFREAFQCKQKEATCKLW